MSESKSEKPKTVACPQCKKPAVMERSNPFRPFCSERCKLIDLGDWASERYSIPTDETPTPGSEESGKDH